MVDSLPRVSPQAVSYIEVDRDSDGQRIDNFLIARLKGLPKSQLYRILRRGEVRVNKGRIKPSFRVSCGDIVRVPPPRLARAAEPGVVGKGLGERLENNILFESESLLIVDKPSGLAVHGGSGVNLGVIEAMRQLRPGQRSLELVHRLDRDTAGCLMIAKKRSVLRHMHAQLREEQVGKVYLALVAGRWPRRRRLVEAPLRKNERRSGERMVVVAEDGKDAITQFEVVQRFAGATLLRVHPLTGRTHQIRVHAQHAGHPLIGDDKYGDKEVNQAMRQHGAKRLFLHAEKLTFTLPDGESQTVCSPLPQELQRVLDALDKPVAGSR